MVIFMFSGWGLGGVLVTGTIFIFIRMNTMRYDWRTTIHSCTINNLSNNISILFLYFMIVKNSFYQIKSFHQLSTVK